MEILQKLPGNWASGLSKLHGWQSRNSEIEFLLQMNGAYV